MSWASFVARKGPEHVWRDSSALLGEHQQNSLYQRIVGMMVLLN